MAFRRIQQLVEALRMNIDYAKSILGLGNYRRRSQRLANILEPRVPTGEPGPNS